MINEQLRINSLAPLLGELSAFADWGVSIYLLDEQCSPLQVACFLYVLNEQLRINHLAPLLGELSAFADWGVSKHTLSIIFYTFQAQFHKDYYPDYQ